ncbi:acetyltransferase [Bacillus sp. EB106-08-02-XG196]|jgi:peptidoglycan/LPS O-acetylase OafA/YrhL|uniref:acyltransferase family protein n=1 Tax=Bacillus sp. EB106-08-02-XG196 TaxID=2737049 RepID=UPI0015C45AC0|nr:acyltransferase family protein [Bacillus sp. EB106-08-02-XG196]NWQ42572.1 acetyltransferase [Bacillus sp. EB106-08-02-XG196]
MSISSNNKRRYMPGIDGLRAVAVMGVILYHLNIPWFQGGFSGVTVFFVLSGYLITDILIDEWNKTNKIDYLRFMIRRFRRLAPAVLVMIFTVTLWVIFSNHPSFDKLRSDFLPSLLYMTNWWYIIHEVSYFESFGPASPFTHLWSLAIEEQFYLIWPLLMILGSTFIKKKRFRVLAVLAGVVISAWLMAFLYIPGEDPSRVYYGTDTRAFSLLLGAALAFVWPSQRLSKTLPRHASIVLEIVGITSLLLIITLFVVTSQFDPFHYQGGMLLLSIFTTLVVAALAHPASKLAKWLSVKPLQWMGVRSYGIYLWHYPFIILTTPIVNTDGLNLWRITLQIFFTLILSELSYRFVEVPIRAGKLKTLLTGLKGLPINHQRIVLGSCAALLASFVGICVVFASKTTVVVPHQEALTIEAFNEIEFNDDDPAKVPEAEEEITKPEPDLKTITVIGDSILHEVAPYFKNHYPEATIDYRVGRQMSEVPEVIKMLEGSGQLGEYVFIQLGTNGSFVKTDLVNLIKGLENKKVYLVNCRVPRPWETNVNQTLEEVVKSVPNTVLVDWYSASEGHPEYFAQDGVHLTRTGGETYANLLVEQMEE